jgi:hypothetical protein
METTQDNQVSDIIVHHLGAVYDRISDMPMPLKERNELELRLCFLQDLAYRIPHSVVISEEDLEKTTSTLRAAVYGDQLSDQ